MSELYREIEEDIRAERTQQLWQRFGKSAVWLSVAVVAGTAAGVLWNGYQQSQRMQRTHQLILGEGQYESGDYKAAAATFGALTEGASAQAAIAQLQKAAAQNAAGDKEAAQKTLAALSQSREDKQAAFAGLAALQSGELSAPPAKDAPFYYSLSEARGWRLVEEGKKPEAVALFAALYRDAQTPPSMQQRLRLALQRLSPETLSDYHEP